MTEPAKRVRRRWKRCESDIAAKLGGRRIPITGRQRGDVPDVEHEWLSIEVKSRKKVPQWMRDGMAQAQAAAIELERKAREEHNEERNYLPALVIHENGQRYDNALIAMPLGDFVEWFGGDDHER